VTTGLLLMISGKKQLKADSMSATFQIPAILDSYRSLRDRTLKLTFETSEMSPQNMSDIQYSLLKVGFLAFKPDAFATHELNEIDALKVEYNDVGKPPSYRLRAVLYRMWEQQPEGYTAFNDYYVSHMEQLIEHFKGRLA
jgi:hypothetical protein